MKRILVILLAVGVGFAAAVFIVSQRQSARHAAELAERQAAWDAEKAGLEAALEKARTRPAAIETTVAQSAGQSELAASTNTSDPQAVLNRLVALKVAPGDTRTLRQVLALLGQLTEAGPSALPAISQFLASNRDVAYESGGGKNSRDVSAMSGALVPPTLRFGLFDVVRQIGGEEAETILASALGQTGRAVEVAYLTQLLEEMSPGKFRDSALSVAKSLLASTAAGPDRDYLFSVLRRFGDESYVATAQAQLVASDGKVDRSALRYLQQTLGEKSIAIAAQSYRDARVTEADAKESLARVALSYVGVNELAEELFHTAVLDQTLKPDHRRELVEDLNRDGLNNKKSLTAEDLKTIASRYALTQAYLQMDYVQNDKVLNAAFLEANKDLNKMLQRAAAAATPAK